MSGDATTSVYGGIATRHDSYSDCCNASFVVMADSNSTNTTLKLVALQLMALQLVVLQLVAL
jgi:hypothetical protein